MVTLFRIPEKYTIYNYQNDGEYSQQRKGGATSKDIGGANDFDTPDTQNNNAYE